MAKLMLGMREVTPAIFTGGTTPAGTLSITQNGTYDVINYASADVNVSGGGGYAELPSYQVDANGVATRRSGALTGIEFSNITEIGTYGMLNAFQNCAGLTGALDLSALTSIGTYGMSCTFQNCTGLTSVDLSALTSIGSDGMYYAFYRCTGLTSVDLSALTSIGNSGMHFAFYNCTGLTSVDLSALISIDDSGMQYAFQDCTGLTSVDLSALASIGSVGMQYAFRGCTGLENVYFRALTTASFGSKTNQFNNMMYDTGTTKTHTLHFPSNLQSTISGLSGYPTFGGTSGYVVCAFDLPATS